MVFKTRKMKEKHYSQYWTMKTSTRRNQSVLTNDMENCRRRTHVNIGDLASTSMYQRCYILLDYAALVASDRDVIT